MTEQSTLREVIATVLHETSDVERVHYWPHLVDAIVAAIASVPPGDREVEAAAVVVRGLFWSPHIPINDVIREALVAAYLIRGET